MEKYYLWLLTVLGEGSHEITRLLNDFGNPEEVYRAFEKNVTLVGAEITAKAEKTGLESAEKQLADLEKLDIKMITIDSEEYPENLKHTANPPCVLFAQGNTDILRRKLLTVVGSRAVTEYTQSVIPSVIKGLGDEYAVASSLSEGCDQLTCLNSLKYGGPFIEVMPCGISQTYPAGSKTMRKFLLDNGGLIISEFLPKTRSSLGSFTLRSRIIGGISKVTLVLQAGAGSGALATAEFSRAPLFLPPNDVFRSEYVGAVNAVRKGGKLYFGTPDIEAAFRRAEESENVKEETTPSPEKTKAAAKSKFRKTNKPAADRADKTEKSKNTPPEAPVNEAGEADFESREHYLIYCAVRDSKAPVGAEELILRTGLSSDKTAEVLLDLEIDGRLSNEHNKYSVT